MSEMEHTKATLTGAVVADTDDAIGQGRPAALTKLQHRLDSHFAKAADRLRQALEGDAARQACSELAASVAERLRQQVGEGFELLAVVGGNAASPGCAVHDAGEALAPGSGIFMLALQAELRRRGIEVPFQAMRDASPDLLDEDIAHFRQLLLAANLGERAG